MVMFDSNRGTEFADRAATRATGNHLDGSAIGYEAARLAHHRVVVAAYFDGAGVACFLIAKGGTEVEQYLRGEVPALDFESVLAADEAAATALRAAFLRLDKPALRLVE